MVRKIKIFKNNGEFKKKKELKKTELMRMKRVKLQITS